MMSLIATIGKTTTLPRLLLFTPHINHRTAPLPIRLVATITTTTTTNNNYNNNIHNKYSNNSDYTSRAMEQAANRDAKRKAWGNKRQQKKEYREKNSERLATQGSRRISSESDQPSAGSFRTKEMQDLFGITVEDIKDDKEEPISSTTKQNDTPRGKKKVVMLIAFCGSKYSGFQINPNANSIQAQLELALYRSKLILPTNFGYPHKYGWNSSARTDKGVHALAQVCSVKLELGEDTEDQARARINAELPDDITILDIRRTTRTFCAKSQRTKVVYQYMIPSFLLYPRDELQTVFKDMGYPRNGQDAKVPLTSEEIQKVKPILYAYKATPLNLERLQAALLQFQGTKPYHNFTKNMKVGDKTAKRYILDFVVDPPVLMEDGTEWIPTRVTGQSFLFNQIRKMVSVAVDVARGAATPQQLDEALDLVTMKTGLAPAQGLFLEMSDYSGYNEHKANQDMPDLDWMQQPESDAMQRRKAFRDDYILKHIGKEEAEQSNFITYLYNMEFIFARESSYRVLNESVQKKPHEDGEYEVEGDNEGDYDDEEPAFKVAKFEPTNREAS